ncbi:MAG: hypothetical protein NZ519_11180 [Bacteroidia bacterium]|nr:hypothetical protein [Bacteroidia bacterium]MDW8302546.1 hypothetical protein [Bacteroidia bacterium]
MDLLKAFLIGVRLAIPAQGMSHGHIRMFYKGIKGLENEYYDQDKIQKWDKEIKTAYQDLKSILDTNEHISEKVIEMDKVCQQYNFLENLQEYFVDIGLIDFFIKSPLYAQEDYFETQEWLRIEEELADRGTELLNWLLYIEEAKSAQAEISLQNYIEDFLLIGDEMNEDQDNLKIYEPLIDVQDFLDQTPLDLFLLYERIPEDHPLKNIAFPMMCYFRANKPIEACLLSCINCGGNIVEHGSVLACALCATHGWADFPQPYQKYFE